MSATRHWAWGLGLLVSVAVILTGCGSHVFAWHNRYAGITWHNVTYRASKTYLRNHGQQIGTWANFAMPDFKIFSVPGEAVSQAICLQTSKGYLLFAAHHARA